VKGEEVTPKQEEFIRLYIELGNASEAYRRVFAPEKGVGARQVAARWLKVPHIAARVAELRAELAARHDITLDKLTTMTLDAYEIGKTSKDPQAMVSAVKQISKMHGFDTEKRPNERSPLADLPADVRRALVDHIEAAARAAKGDRGGSPLH
jgi:phage terminase small subunit